MIEKQKLHKTVIVTQLNCRGLNQNKIEILDILAKTLADIACLNETNLGRKSHPNLVGYTLGYILNAALQDLQSTSDID